LEQEGLVVFVFGDEDGVLEGVHRGCRFPGNLKRKRVPVASEEVRSR
jgi:hypothetical protein